VSQFRKKNSQPSSRSVDLPPAPSSISEPRKWVAVELTSLGEKEKQVNIFAAAVKKLLGRPLEVFVPAISQSGIEATFTTFYMDGYVFIEYVVGVNYLRLRETAYFREVLCGPGSRHSGPKYSLIEDKDLNPVRSGMDALKKKPFSVGDPVMVTQGFYRNLRGTVSLVYEDSDKIQIHINQLDSKPLMMEFPNTCIEKVTATTD
jgi:transcription antitermination factor NusG